MRKYSFGIDLRKKKKEKVFLDSGNAQVKVIVFWYWIC